jgi:hypothetical protein
VDDLSDKLEITFQGKKRELFMSYLRQNSCLRVIGNPQNLASLLVDPDLSENILRVMLAEKGGAGAMFEVELDENDLSGEDIDRILLWVQRHLTAFFMKRFQQAQASAKELEPAIKALESQAGGSAA